MLNIHENGNSSVFHPVGGGGDEFTRTCKSACWKGVIHQ